MIDPTDCDHDGTVEDTAPHASRCTACGMNFTYCHGCSTYGSVYHEPPACDPCPTHKTKDCTEQSKEETA